MASEGSTVRVEDVMTGRVMTLTRSQSMGHVRKLMLEHGVHSFPVVGGDGELQGIITSSDLLGKVSDDTHIGQVMTKEIYTIPAYSGVDLAARIMRNHGIHHVVITRDKRVEGIVSSFDLLQLVEGKRFVARNAPTKSKKGGRRRLAEESGAG